VKIRARILLILIGSALVSFAVLGVAAWVLLRESVRDASVHRLAMEADLLARELQGSGSDASPAEFASRASRALGVRVTFIATDGVVVADSAVGPGGVARMDNHLGRPEIRDAFRYGKGESYRPSNTTRIRSAFIARRVEGEKVAYIRLGVAADELERFSLRYLLLFLASALAGLMLLLLVAWVLLGRVARPIENVSAVAEQISSGQLGVDVPAQGPEELDRLAFAMNTMKASLVAKLDELAAERTLLRAMTEGLGEGLLLVDAEHRILIANDAFRRIFRLGFDPMGRLVGEVVRHPVVLEQLDACLLGDGNRRATVSGPAGTNRSFELHATSVDVAGPDRGRGALVLLFDITQLEALEQVRQRFIADVSHELRTPVTSIKGAIETLLDTPGTVTDDGIRFLEMAGRQADRMSHLIADLTDLSRIETGAIALECRHLDLAHLAADAAEAVLSRHKSRNVEIIRDIPEGLRVLADPRRLEQILINLVDNGVKYTPDGGRVTISARRQDGYDQIAVEDTGPGIPRESVDKVFNRFYRVDKARSRDLGGTGLGLAIVKHLVKLHHGTIRVESPEGGGARFVFDLPVSPPIR
jgi:two-component system phosphate regulon sensor histidine kinase PhoR